jgi:hypothetical protein
MRHLLQLREAIAATERPSGWATVTPEVLAQVEDAARADGLRRGNSGAHSFVAACYDWSQPGPDSHPLVTINPDVNLVLFTYWFKEATR